MPSRVGVPRILLIGYFVYADVRISNMTSCMHHQAMWYSWNQGPVHFVSINTETDWPGAAEEKHGDSGILPAGSFGRDGEFQAWLEADLAAANASRTLRPWIVVGGHKPLGSISRTIFPPLLAKYVTTHPLRFFC